MCADCELVFSRRIPTDQELYDYYDGYRREFISEITLRRYDEILEGLEGYRQTNNLLDVGCGAGYFLLRAQERGWNVFGTEFTDEAVQHCRSKGVTMHQGQLDHTAFQGLQFDVITSFEVIEHIHNHREELGHFDRLLRPGGAAYLTTPNFNSLSRKVMGARWGMVHYPEHLTYFTPISMKRMFEPRGYDVKKIVTTGLSISQLKNHFLGTNESHNTEGSSDQQLRERMEASSSMGTVKRIANHVLNAFQLGDTIKATFVKNG